MLIVLTQRYRLEGLLYILVVILSADNKLIRTVTHIVLANLGGVLLLLQKAAPLATLHPVVRVNEVKDVGLFGQLFQPRARKEEAASDEAEDSELLVVTYTCLDVYN